jgi:glycosyltransferase involved in cell wall biosynthesis
VQDKKVKVSICIPTYNGQDFIEQCLRSALAQTYANLEIIVVDDCSTDSTPEIAGRYAAKDSRIKLFRNEKNLGLTGNWNRCLKLASGDWIKFLFQDDYLDPDCVEVMIDSISPSDMMVSSARRLVIDEAVDEATRNYSIRETLTFERLGIAAQAPVHITPQKIASLTAGHICMNFIGEPTVIMFKKEVVNNIGLFNTDLVQICDLEYFLRIACNYGLKYIPRQLTYFRVHKKSASSANIANKIFFMRFADPVIMAAELLNGTGFQRFRKSISIPQKLKLKLFFLARMYETVRYLKTNVADNTVKDRFERLNDTYNFTGKYMSSKIIAALLMPALKLKRLK